MKKALLVAFIVIWAQWPLASQERFRKSPPFPDPFPEWSLPAVDRVTLSNGLTLGIVNRPNSPLLSLALVVFAGESVSPDNLPGLASFTGEMLNRGTLELSSTDIEEKVETIGGEFSHKAFPDFSVFTLHFLEEYLDEALFLLSRMILQPIFPEREVVNLKRTMFYDLLERSRDADFLAKRQLYRVLFRGHPYEKFLFSEEVIKNITRKDVLTFFNKYYRPNNSILIVIGNINRAGASRKVSHYLNTWEKIDVPRVPSTLPASLDEEKVCFIDSPQAREVTLLLGNVVFPPSSPDFFPFAVLNQVLGGTPNSRLFMNLRESKGIAYYAFSGLEFFRNCGVFLVRARVQPPFTSDSLEEIRKEIQRVSREKALTFEVEQAKSYLIGNFPLRLANYADFALRVVELMVFDLGEGHWNNYFESIIPVDAAGIIEAGQSLLNARPAAVIVGDKNALGPYFKNFDKIDIFDQKGKFLYSLTKGAER